MSKKDGAAFSKSLFGYKKRDVNEYIRLADESNAEKTAELEARIKELQDVIASDRASFDSNIKKLEDEKKTIAQNFESSKQEFEDKLAESEARGAAYLKLADASALRAESAELRIAALSAELENQKAEVIRLKEKIVFSEEQIAKLNSDLARAASREDKEKTEKVRFFRLRRPTFFKTVKK